MKKNSLMSVVRYFVLIAVKVKQCGDCSQLIAFSSSEEKQCNDHSHTFHFKSSEVKQRSECSE